MLDKRKKPLQLKKKPKKNQNPISVIANPANCTATYLNQTCRNYFLTQLYALCTKPQFAEDPRPTNEEHGTLVIHIDSIFTHQTFRKQMRNSNEPFKWQGYYDSFLNEPLRLDYLWVVKAARDYGLVLRGLSTTPKNYSEVIKSFLIRHNLFDDFKSITYPEKPWRSESQWLRHELHRANTSFYPIYCLFDRQQYPKIKTHSLSLIY